jgi:5-methyltetrahydrofolate--homocysteine methyltransferase
MGTVRATYDIGKNLVSIMFEAPGSGHRPRRQVAPEKFVAAIQEHKPDIVGFSAFLTTTMPMFKANINALNKAGLRDQVIVMVGGAPVTQEYADVVGADGYAADASAPWPGPRNSSRSAARQSTPNTSRTPGGEPARAHHPVLGDQDGADR